MCGRFTLRCASEEIGRIFEVEVVPRLAPRFNIAPTQLVSVIGVRASDRARVHHRLRWGLIPHWTELSPASGKPPAGWIMARSETAADKPAFRDPFRHGRCLIVADGFYEWRTEPDGRKQPFFFRLRSGEPFGFAGLWDRWRANDGRVLVTCAILTQDAAPELRIVHTRMPVVIAPSHYGQWLDPEQHDPECVEPALRRSLPGSAFEVYPVSTRVNDTSNDDAELIVPA